MASPDPTTNFEPLWRRWPADLDTPLSTWLKVGHGCPYGVLLESVEGGEHLGRWSFVASDPLWVLSVRGDQAWLEHRDGRRETCLLYTSPSPRDRQKSRMPSSA